MRLIHKVPFSSQEVEGYRQLVFNNLTQGLKYLLDAMEDMELEIDPENAEYAQLMTDASDVGDGEPFPVSYYEPLKRLWADSNVQKAWGRGNEAALPEKYVTVPSPLDLYLIVFPACATISRNSIGYSTHNTCQMSKILSSVVRGQSVSRRRPSLYGIMKCLW
jgi:hypothetical protein